MQKQNGYKFFERTMLNESKLNDKDYKELALIGVTKADSLRYFANLRKNDLSIIPSEAEQDKKKQNTNERPRRKKENVIAA
jgi:hypothetical protein